MKDDATIIAYFLRSKTPQESMVKSKTSAATHKHFFSLAKSRNLDLRFVLGEDAILDEGFSNYWIFENDELINVSEAFKEDMLYAKNRSNRFETRRKLNNSYLENICIDKLVTAQMFPDLCKKTLLIDENSLSNLDEINTEKVVLKPQEGSNGVHVTVLSKQEITKDLLATDTYIVQELIDSSGGIPNLINKRHEMRIYIFNGVIQSAYLRIPPEDSYLCNVAQGAKEMQITLDQIPDSFIASAAKVDAVFSEIVPRHYTVDIMNENGRPWIVELNNTPGLPDPDVQPLSDNYFNALLDVLTNKEIKGISLHT